MIGEVLFYGIDSTTGTSLWNVDSGTPGSWHISDILPFQALGAGEGVLVVPNGTRLVTYTLATSP